MARPSLAVLVCLLAPLPLVAASLQEEWVLNEDWRIGGLYGDGPEAFGSRALNVGISPRGEVFVADTEFRDVRVFDSSGRFLRTIGRPGQGPGEFTLPVSMGWDAQDRLWVADLGGLYHLFDSSGDLIEAFRRVPAPPANTSGQGAFDVEGHFLDEIDLNLNFPPQRRVIAYVRIDDQGAVVDTLPSLVGPRFDLRANGPVPRGLTAGASPGVNPNALSTAELSDFHFVNDLVPQLVHTVSPDGSLWSADSNRYRLTQRSPRGDTLRAFDGPREVPPLTSAEEERLLRVSTVMNRRPGDFVYGRQPIRLIHVLDDGHVLVGIEEEPGTDVTMNRPGFIGDRLC